MLSSSNQSLIDVPEWVGETDIELLTVEEHGDHSAFYVGKA